jgi:hypothetical protein
MRQPGKYAASMPMKVANGNGIEINAEIKT